MVLWARRHLGEEHVAEVLEVFPTGLLLRLGGSNAEGFLPLEMLGDERFAFDEERFELRGERSGRRFPAGQRLRVTLAGANLFTRRIDFFLEEGPEANDTNG